MSQYIRILNAIRKNIARLSLTKSQADCRIAILERLEYPGVVNLYGPHGSGKTVLGWCLASEGQAAYLVEPTRLMAAEQAPKVFIDNAGHRRSDYRRILGDLERARIRQAVIVTLERIEDSVQAFELYCTPEDTQIACANLTQLGYPVGLLENDSSIEPPPDLWNMLQRAARRE